QGEGEIGRALLGRPGGARPGAGRRQRGEDRDECGEGGRGAHGPVYRAGGGGRGGPVPAGPYPSRPMNISLRWLNQYLSPGDLGANRQGGARRTLKHPEDAEPASRGRPVGDDLSLENREPGRCPLFTARLVRGVKIGPSPAWLREALESVGQRSINNVVDVTNFITMELGNPCHVFDYRKLAGGRLVVRFAEPGERVRTLYAGEHELRATDLVVADAERPQSLAGVIGGHDSQVDETTTDVVLEVATWDPVTIRNTGRRLNIRTDAAYRFERGIDAGTVDAAARRAARLICEVSGGELASGELRAG